MQKYKDEYSKQYSYIVKSSKSDEHSARSVRQIYLSPVF